MSKPRASKNKSMTISAETRQRIEDSLHNWDQSESNARKRFENAERPWKATLQSLDDAIAASEQITHDDLAIRINTRD